LDVAAATARTAKALPAVASLLEKQITVLSHGQLTEAVRVADIFDPAALVTFKRLVERCRVTGTDCWELLWCGRTAGWEQCMTKSFAAGVSLNLEESTIKQMVRDRDAFH
jgi:hypothetical protein